MNYEKYRNLMDILQTPVDNWRIPLGFELTTAHNQRIIHNTGDKSKELQIWIGSPRKICFEIIRNLQHNAAVFGTV
jgi:hypothetical protein